MLRLLSLIYPILATVIKPLPQRPPLVFTMEQSKHLTELEVLGGILFFSITKMPQSEFEIDIT